MTLTSDQELKLTIVKSILACDVDFDDIETVIQGAQQIYDWICPLVETSQPAEVETK
jgi:hypothetical protein